MSHIYQSLRVRQVFGVVSTDDIIPGRYKHASTDPSELATHVFENMVPGLAATFKPGDVISCDDTFGIGSSREQAVSSLLAAGVVAVFAPRFGRIFFRNSWNLGLLAIEIDSLPALEGEIIDLEPSQGLVKTPSGIVQFTPPSTEMLEMVKHGGLLAQIRKQLVETAIKDTSQ
ncbi:LeuD/DmdB family oxidoreductase small subunit [Nostoc sp.]|uniref:LeuD/DmdB family oxidoreductase small subunit n=1 Tax=Nostoc sp. TaxID=1180 RepID=UPI002FF66BCB